MKARWNVRRLGDLLKVQNGYAFDSKEFNPSKGMPLIRIRSLKAGVETETRFSGTYDNKYVVNAGDLLIGMDGEFGCYAWKGEPALLNQRVCRLQGFDLQLVPRFLFYGVNSYLKAIEDVTGFTTVKHISSKQILDIDFPIPPLPEQQRIVTLLDEAFDGIATAKANAEKNLQNARELFELQLATSLRPGDQGWVDASIGDVCTLKSGTTVPVDIERQNGDVPYVKVAEMTMPANRDGVTTSIRFINQLDIKPSWLIPAGAVIFPKRGGAIMTNKKRLALVDICVDLNIMSVIPSEKLTSEFLYLYFLAVDMRKLGTGSSIPQINNYDIAPLLISFPASKARQLEITDALRDIETECQTLVALYDRKLAALDDLKKALLQYAFTGQLTAKKADELVEAVA